MIIMNFGKLLVVGMIIVIATGLIASFSDFRNPSENHQEPQPISYTICPFVNPAYVEEWAKEVDDPENLATVLMKSFNASLDPNYPLAVLHKLAEDGKVRRVYQRYAYSFANGSKTVSASSGWHMENRYLAVPPIREITPDSKNFDLLYGMIYTEMDGKAVVFLYYLSNPATVEKVEGISLFYPENLDIINTTGGMAWRCWHHTENGEKIGSCEGEGKGEFAPSVVDTANSVGIETDGSYGYFVVVFNGTVNEQESLPISTKIAVVTNGREVGLPLGRAP
ncbi:hypothetical protein [Thermococcus thioreducens]|uniref:Uncharacterized protein n=1 Tax=Thermococcus thioreducens TaxID=277988 RepID=A0A0Q2UNG9_9EURY|nr:hypothetical protein [Thermococcus thioreducens]ASJ12753.1 hypothetical protein A3L14_07580 [Thermococcus thioreducens]KQH82224.1 hypothetical protein AMR53_06340 [Thermococcus thioreducens]SEV85735.1 hypothetical protein SAMN05216170_0433 [Thermococcus thioreducens]